MNEQKSKTKEKKGFFSRWMAKLDKKLEDKAKKTPCCAPKDKDSQSSCC